MKDALMTPREAAEYLRVTPQRLAAWRHERRGPRFSKAGALVRYRLADLDQWLGANAGPAPADRFDAAALVDGTAA